VRPRASSGRPDGLGYRRAGPKQPGLRRKSPSSARAPPKLAAGSGAEVGSLEAQGLADLCGAPRSARPKRQQVRAPSSRRPGWAGLHGGRLRRRDGPESVAAAALACGVLATDRKAQIGVAGADGTVRKPS